MKLVTLAQLILACSLSSEPEVENTLYQVVMVGSQGAPYFIQTGQGHTYLPKTRERAETLLSGVLAVPGARVHIGLSALPSSRLKAHTLEPERALDACTNVGIASLELEALLQDATTLQARHEALAAYHAPDDPTSTTALAWGARVLASPEVDVREEAESDTPREGPTFKLVRSAFYAGGEPKAPALEQTEENASQTREGQDEQTEKKEEEVTP